MNVLAHFHLAGDDPDLQSGALLGDHIKGPLKGNLPEGWEAGIRLHRRIDALTDSSEAVRALLKTCDAGFRRYLGITLDVVFDHCLCRHWQRFSELDLQSYSDRLFAQMLPRSEHWPADARRHLQRLHQHNVLVELQHWHTVDAMIRGIARRLSRPEPLITSIDWAQRQLPAIDEAFLALYPHLQARLAAEFPQLRTQTILKDTTG